MFKVGDLVEVQDEGLAMLRQICPTMPPNNIGTIASIKHGMAMIEFPIDGKEGHTQTAPFELLKLRLVGKDNAGEQPCSGS